MKEAKDPYKALLNYRNTPLEGIGLSPAQLLMDRRLKISLPTHADLLKTRGAQEVKEHVQKRKPGKTRICLDLRDLNRAIQRPKSLAPLTQKRVFTRLDQMKRSVRKQLSPFGRYIYLRMSFGISVAP